MSRPPYSGPYDNPPRRGQRPRHQSMAGSQLALIPENQMQYSSGRDAAREAGRDPNLEPMDTGSHGSQQGSPQVQMARQSAGSISSSGSSSLHSLASQQAAAGVGTASGPASALASGPGSGPAHGQPQQASSAARSGTGSSPQSGSASGPIAGGMDPQMGPSASGLSRQYGYPNYSRHYRYNSQTDPVAPRHLRTTSLDVGGLHMRDSSTVSDVYSLASPSASPYMGSGFFGGEPSQHPPPMSQIGQMGQMSQMSQMNQMNQMNQMSQMSQMGQMGGPPVNDPIRSGFSRQLAEPVGTDRGQLKYIREAPESGEPGAGPGSPGPLVTFQYEDPLYGPVPGPQPAAPRAGYHLPGDAQGMPYISPIFGNQGFDPDTQAPGPGPGLGPGVGGPGPSAGAGQMHLQSAGGPGSQVYGEPWQHGPGSVPGPGPGPGPGQSHGQGPPMTDADFYGMTWQEQQSQMAGRMYGASAPMQRQLEYSGYPRPTPVQLGGPGPGPGPGPGLGPSRRFDEMYPSRLARGPPGGGMSVPQTGYPPYGEPDDDGVMNIPGPYYEDDKETQWLEQDLNELFRLLDLSERHKWKYISDRLLEREDKRIPALACQRKFKELFGGPEAESDLKSSLFYIAYRSGWKTIRDETTQSDRAEPPEWPEEVRPSRKRI